MSDLLPTDDPDKERRPVSNDPDFVPLPSSIGRSRAPLRPTRNRLQSNYIPDQVRPARVAPWEPLKIRVRAMQARKAREEAREKARTLPIGPKQARLCVLRFGKYKGMTFGAILAAPGGRSYLRWLLRQDWFQGQNRQALETLLASPGA